MADKLFFKKLTPTEWLGLRVPAGLAIDIGDNGSINDPGKAEYDSATALPPGIQQIAFLTLAPDANAGELSANLVRQAPPPQLGQPFAQARSVIDASGGQRGLALADEIKKLASVTSLSLQLYWIYRNTQPGRTASYATPAELSRLYGSSGNKFRLESFSELLFIAICAPDGGPTGDPASGVFVDWPEDADVAPDGIASVPGPLTLAATQMMHGVTLQLKGAAGPITNKTIFEVICPQPVEIRDLGCSYRLSRTLGLAERSPSSVGPVFIPPPAPAPAPLAAGAHAEIRPPDEPASAAFSIFDPMKPAELVGELLNYDVQLFNPHGRCTHRGRIIIKRERLDRPAPPANPVMVLQRPAAGNAAACTLTCALNADHIREIEGGTLYELVIYRYDFPVVPTGFYGDEDDQSLLVARRMADLDTALFSPADYGTDAMGPQSAVSINLSNHNLMLVQCVPARAQARQEVTLAMPFDLALATQFFVAVRRVLESPAARLDNTTESIVAPVLHRLGQAAPGLPGAPVDPESARVVPHFEAYWLAPTVRASLLGDGQARVIEVRRPAGGAQDAAPPLVTVLIQHKRPDDNGEPQLIGGYRLWMRELLAAQSGEPFTPVALVQALPPLVKAYAPLESGRRWLRVKPSQPAEPGNTGMKQAQLTEPDFFIAQTMFEVGVPDSTKVALKQAVADTESELVARGMDPTVFRERAQQANQALDSAPINFSKLRDDLSRHDGNGLDDEGTLRAVLSLKEAGLAQEVILSVRKRQRLQQHNMEHFPGHWLFFQDQNGIYLGRALHFWAPDGTDPAAIAGIGRFYILREAPSAHDAVGMDDFGRIAWSWNGIRDFWRHELEWLVEPIGRYEPMLGNRAGLDPYSNRPGPAIDQSHRLSIQRTAPLQAKFSLVQGFAPQPEQAPDAFLVRLIAPDDFRQALHSTAARTRLGVLRTVPAIAARMLADQNAFAIDAKALFSACLAEHEPLDDAQAPALISPPHLDDPGTFAELIIDEPACVKLGVSMQARADGVSGPASQLNNMQRAPLKITVPDELAPRITRKEPRRIIVPLARLGWTYTGQRQLAVASYIDPAGNPQLENFRSQFGAKALLYLPDPYSECIVFLQRDGLARPVLHFAGPSERLASSGFAGLTPTPLEPAWGSVYRDEAHVTAAGFENDALVLDVLTAPGKYYCQWRIQGLSTEMLRIKEAQP